MHKQYKERLRNVFDQTYEVYNVKKKAEKNKFRMVG